MNSIEGLHAEIQDLQASHNLLLQHLGRLEETDVLSLQQERLENLDYYMTRVPPRHPSPQLSMHDFLLRQYEKWDQEPEKMMEMEKNRVIHDISQAKSDIAYLKDEISKLKA